MTYKASLDKITKVMTIIVTVLMVGAMFSPAFSPEKAGKVMPFVLSGFIIISYLLAYLFRPLRYSVSGDKLTIHRPIGNVVINKSDIEQVVALSSDDLKMTIRTFGVGGLFGFYGWFYNTRLGKMTWYATRRTDAVLVKTKASKKIVLTPDETEQFVSAFAGVR
jgi:hypothetical protein